MPIIDLTLANPIIRGYFEGKNEKVPSAEFMYVHTHPATKNFLSEIEVLINETNIVLQVDPKKKGLVVRLSGHARRYAELLGKVTDETAPEILATLREIYQLCGRIHAKPLLNT